MYLYTKRYSNRSFSATHSTQSRASAGSHEAVPIECRTSTGSHKAVLIECPMSTESPEAVPIECRTSTESPEAVPIERSLKLVTFTLIYDQL